MQKILVSTLMAFFLGVFFLSGSVFAAETGEPIVQIEEPLPTEHLFWERVPLTVTLKVGEERIIHFPGATLVQVGIPGKLNRGILRTQIVDNTIYWLANEPFSSERIQIMNAGTGETYLFDLQAQKETPPLARIELISVIEKEKVAQAKIKKERAQNAKGVKMDYVDLVRFAATQMYAPLRLVRNMPGLTSLPIEPDKKVPLVRGGNVEAMPLMVWRAEGLYVSAVRLKNVSQEYVTLDPRKLRGDWLTATFQHVRLMPEGHEADTTCVYLISRHHPFEF